MKSLAADSLRRLTLALVVGLLVVPVCRTAMAGEARIAVASNFTAAANEIAALFEAGTGHTAILSFGSTGQLYAQISQVAPFDVFLAADRERPRLAVENGLAVSDTSFTYANGKLVLFSRETDRISGEATLRDGDFARLAIANPITAPYGAAAMEVLAALGLADTLEPKLVRGNNITQVYQFVETGNAELGFVALSQLKTTSAGSRWIVPETLHTPIAQDAVLLEHGADNAAARSFLEFLGSPEAAAVIQSHGYGTGR